MKSYSFSSITDMQIYMDDNEVEVNREIVKSISEAVQYQKRVAYVMEVGIDNSDYIMEITIPRKKWASSLANCLELFKEEGTADDQIDTWQLIQEVKKWSDEKVD